MSSFVSALQSLGTDLNGVFGGGANNVAMGNMASTFSPFGSASPAGLQNIFQSQGPVTSAGGTQTGATSQTPNLGPIGQLYLQYLASKRLQQRSAPGFGVAQTQQPQFNPFVGAPAAIMPPQVQL